MLVAPAAGVTAAPSISSQRSSPPAESWSTSTVRRISVTCSAPPVVSLGVTLMDSGMPASLPVARWASSVTAPGEPMVAPSASLRTSSRSVRVVTALAPSFSVTTKSTVAV